MPFSAAVFGYVPLFGILASAITVPLMPGTLLLGILSAACGTSSLGKLLGKGCRAFLLVIEEVSKRFSGWLLPLRDSFILIGIFFVVLLLFTGFLLKKRLPALCLSLAVFSVCLGFSALFQEQHLAAAEIRGEESTVTMIYRGREAVVVGMGSGMEEEVTSFLRSRGVCRVAALVLPASSRAVSEDCYSFCQNNEVEKLIAPKENRYAFSARELAGEFWEFSPGRYSLFGGEMELRQGKSGGVILFTFPEGEAALLPREINVPYEREKIIFYNGP